MATAPAPIQSFTVTSLLEEIFDGAIVPSMAAIFPILSGALNIPVIGALLTDGIEAIGNWLIANGVIEVKIGLINMLDSASQQKWASEIVILKQIQALGDTMTTAQQMDFDNALEALVQNRKGVVNA